MNIIVGIPAKGTICQVMHDGLHRFEVVEVLSDVEDCPDGCCNGVIGLKTLPIIDNIRASHLLCEVWNLHNYDDPNVVFTSYLEYI